MCMFQFRTSSFLSSKFSIHFIYRLMKICMNHHVLSGNEHMYHCEAGITEGSRGFFPNSLNASLNCSLV